MFTDLDILPEKQENWKNMSKNSGGSFGHNRQGSDLWPNGSSGHVDKLGIHTSAMVNLHQPTNTKYNKRLVVQINPQIMYNKNQQIPTQLMTAKHIVHNQMLAPSTTKAGNYHANGANFKTQHKNLTMMKTEENVPPHLTKSNSNTHIHNAFYVNNRATDPGFMSVRTRRPKDGQNSNSNTGIHAFSNLTMPGDNKLTQDLGNLCLGTNSNKKLFASKRDLHQITDGDYSSRDFINKGLRSGPGSLNINIRGSHENFCSPKIANGSKSGSRTKKHLITKKGPVGKNIRPSKKLSLLDQGNFSHRFDGLESGRGSKGRDGESKSKREAMHLNSMEKKGILHIRGKTMN
jgi:hypothetical protein